MVYCFPLHLLASQVCVGDVHIHAGAAGSPRGAGSPVSGSVSGGSMGGAGAGNSDVRARFQAAARKAVNLQRSVDGELEDSDTVKGMSNK